MFVSKKLPGIRLVPIELEVGRQTPSECTQPLQDFVATGLAGHFQFTSNERERAESSSQPLDLERLIEAFGSEDRHFNWGLAQQLINAASHLQGDALDFIISVIKGVKPNDQLEAMFVAQMASIHLAVMKFTRQLSEVEHLPQQDSAERALNKLARTFTMQMSHHLGARQQALSDAWRRARIGRAEGASKRAQARPV
jgi:hypothetical protein